MKVEQSVEIILAAAVKMWHQLYSIDGKNKKCHSESLVLWTLSIAHYFKKLEETTFRKLDLFPSSGQPRKASTLLGHLERANLSHCF
jgi:hypothetical protein